MNPIAEIFRDNQIPLIIVRKIGETASAETVLNSFTDGDSGIAIISNSDAIHSPITGEPLTALDGFTSTQTVEEEELSEMASDMAGHSLFMAIDLAFELANETIKSPLTGKDMVVTYVGSEENAGDDEDEDDLDATSDSDDEDGDEGEDGEDDGDIIDDAETLDADSDSDDSDDDSSMEEDDSDDEDSDSDSDDSDDSDDEDDAGELASDEDDDAGQPEMEATLTLESELNKEQPLRLVQTDSAGSEVAVFNGNSYIGSMSRSAAATNTQPLFDNGSKLYAAFKSVALASTDLNSAEVAAFGFTPQKIQVEVAGLVANAIASAKAEVASSVDNERNAVKERFEKVIGMAMLGLNKGFFEGANTFVGETAGVLRSAGVVNAEQTVRRSLVKHAEAYTTAVMEKASELLDQSDDYLRGISESITKTEFIGDTSASPATLTSVFLDPSKEKKSETAGFHSNEKKVVGGNRFTGLVQAIGRNRH